MKFTETKLSGLFVIELQTFDDNRGSFFRTFCKKEFESIGFRKEFVQINQSINRNKYTFRGLHYQTGNHADTKLIRCIVGEVYDIIVDVRPNSPTYLEHFAIHLSDKNKKMLLVPEGFAHGFLTLQDNSQLVYQHTAFYEPGHEGMLNYADPVLGIQLPHEVEVISDRDHIIPFINPDIPLDI